MPPAAAAWGGMSRNKLIAKGSANRRLGWRSGTGVKDAVLGKARTLGPLTCLFTIGLAPHLQTFLSAPDPVAPQEVVDLVEMLARCAQQPLAPGASPILPQQQQQQRGAPGGGGGGAAEAAAVHASVAAAAEGGAAWASSSAPAAASGAAGPSSSAAPAAGGAVGGMPTTPAACVAAGGSEDPLFHWAKAVSVSKMSKGSGVPEWAAQEAFDICYTTGLAVRAMTATGGSTEDTRVAAVQLAQAMHASSSQVHHVAYRAGVYLPGAANRGKGEAAAAAVSAATAAVRREAQSTGAAAASTSAAGGGGGWGGNGRFGGTGVGLPVGVTGASLHMGAFPAAAHRAPNGAGAPAFTAAGAPSAAGPRTVQQLAVGRGLLAAASARAAAAVGVEIAQQQWQGRVVTGAPRQLPSQWAGVEVSGVTAALQALAAVAPFAAVALSPGFPRQIGFRAVDTRGLSALQVSWGSKAGVEREYGESIYRSYSMLIFLRFFPRRYEGQGMRYEPYCLHKGIFYLRLPFMGSLAVQGW